MLVHDKFSTNISQLNMYILSIELHICNDFRDSIKFVKIDFNIILESNLNLINHYKK